MNNDSKPVNQTMRTPAEIIALAAPFYMPKTNEDLLKDGEPIFRFMCWAVEHCLQQELITWQEEEATKDAIYAALISPYALHPNGCATLSLYLLQTHGALATKYVQNYYIFWQEKFGVDVRAINGDTRGITSHDEIDQ